MNKPLVSVLMPVYNGKQFLLPAIESILKQSFRDYEFIIIDDGSQDLTNQIIQKFKQNDCRIVSFTFNKNVGIASALNKGLEMSKGKFIVRMDADDISLPDRLEKQITFMNNHPDIGVVGTCAYVIDEQGRRIESTDFPLTSTLIKWALNYYCPILHPTVMAYRSVICSAGGYNSIRLHAEDYDLWARLSPITRFANLPERLLLLRKHSGNLSAKYRAVQQNNSSAISRDLIRKEVRMELSVTPLELGWSPKRISFPDLAMIKTVILSLRDNFLDLPDLTSFEKRYLHHETALQLARIARNAPSLISAMEMIGQALLCDPFSGIDILSHAIKKLSK